jgi:hypothetical protein
VSSAAIAAHKRQYQRDKEARASLPPLTPKFIPPARCLVCSSIVFGVACSCRFARVA